MKSLAAFPRLEEYEKVCGILQALGLSYEMISPKPGFDCVGSPALVLEQETRARLAVFFSENVVCSGWVDYHLPLSSVPDGLPPCFVEDIFGRAAIMVLAACVADHTKVRLIAHISGDMTEGLPYLNAAMPDAVYNAEGPSLTFMEGHRMVTLYSGRIAVAKADDIIDGWRVLEGIRCRINEVYAHRASIEPLYTKREKPLVLDIYKRLPKINCRRCGQSTCMAFALSLHSGHVSPLLCHPIFEEDYVHLRDRYRAIVARLGFTADDGLSEHS